MSELLEFLGSPPEIDLSVGQSVELCRGLRVRQNTRNPFFVCSLRYEADPHKDPLTPDGHEWMMRAMRDLGCYRVCRSCDTAWDIRDERCPECDSETDLVLSNKWRREMEIDYSAQQGSYVFDAFSRGRNTCKPFRIPASWSRWRLIDHGVRNPTAVLWIAVDEDRNGWVYAEHYEADKSVEYHARKIHSMSSLLDYHALELSAADLRRMELPDWEPVKAFVQKCSKVYRTVGDPSMGNVTQKNVKTIRQRYMDNGVYIQQANRSSAGLETLNSMFSQGTLNIFETCVNTISEVEGLVWAEHHDPALNKKEKTVDRNDHTCDCLRYWANAFAPAAQNIPERPQHPLHVEDRAEADRAKFQKLHQRKINRNDHILDI